jgi:hypothetical protein
VFRSAHATERKFPHCIDVPIPGSSLDRLTAMLDWCRFHVAAAEWAEHGQSKRRKGEASQYIARFYFANAANADAFKRQWTDVIARG